MVDTLTTSLCHLHTHTMPWRPPRTQSQLHCAPTLDCALTTARLTHHRHVHPNPSPTPRSLPRPGPAPSQRARLLTPGAGLGSGGVSPGGIPYALGDGGDDGYQQLQDRLQAAAPPEEVMRVAMR